MTTASREHKTSIRVRCSETDGYRSSPFMGEERSGTFYNSRALEWFECGRTELLRALGGGEA